MIVFCAAFLYLQFGLVIFFVEESWRKSVHKMLAKLTKGVNFDNILRVAFLHESFCPTFMCLQFKFVIFCPKEIGTKAAHKRLVKLTTGLRIRGIVHQERNADSHSSFWNSHGSQILSRPGNFQSEKL
jgi:hypothetical protein